MLKIGLKLWSINEQYAEEAKRLYQEDVLQYIELYAVPESFLRYGALWKSLQVPCIVHAPHFRGGLNLAKTGAFEKNQTLAGDAFKFADALEAPFIIFHPGVGGDIQETIQQLRKFADPRMLIENKPYYALDDNLICNGYSPEEIERVISHCRVGFCLDFGHAICAANAVGVDHMEYLHQFLALSPKLFHLSDGDVEGVLDRHDHFGDGTFPLKEVLALLPPEASISIETDKDYSNRLDDFVKDAEYLRKGIG